MKVASRTTRVSERAPNAVVGHLRPEEALLPVLARVGPAVIQTPVAATLQLLRTVRLRHYRPLSPSLRTPRVRTRVTRVRPTLRWASDLLRPPPRPCNSLPHLITSTQVQRSNTTQVHTDLRDMTSTPHSQDLWRHPLLLAMVSVNPGSPPRPDNGHTVEEQSRVDTHGGEHCICATNTYCVHLSANGCEHAITRPSCVFPGYGRHSL